MEQNTKVIARPAKAMLVPSTSDSYPLGCASRQIMPVELSKFGYAEEEYFMQGTANIYEWPDAQKYPHIKLKNAPYVNRVLVRKPESPANFSGVVIAELFNYAAGYDRSIAGWGQCWKYYVSRGHGWIGISARDTALYMLKNFDPVRYEPLGFPNPIPPENRGEPVMRFGRPINTDNENGVLWDMMSQLGALIKSGAADSPFSGYKVEHLIATGATGGDLSAYVAAIHPITYMPYNSKVFDGFLIYMTGTPGGLTSNKAMMDPLDQRAKFYCDVPFIHINTMGDMFGNIPHPAWACMYRRPDMNEPAQKACIYEVAGAGVGALYPYLSSPCQEDVEKAKGIWKGGDIQPKHEFPIRYVLNAATQNLICWISSGIAPPEASKIEIRGTYPNCKFVLDDYGNVKGGLRTPYVDVPLYRYEPDAKAYRLCRKRLAERYSSRHQYVSEVIDSTIQCCIKRFILPEDAAKIIIDATKFEFPQ